MTFIAGYIYQDTVHIIADSAETVGVGPNEVLEKVYENSSFIEQFQVNDDGKFEVIEAAQKIYTLNGDLIVSFAGDVAEGINGITQFKYFLIQHIGSKFEAVQSFFKELLIEQCEYVVAFFEAGKPHLFRFSKNDFAYSNTSESFVAVGVLGNPIPGAWRDGDSGLVGVVGGVLNMFNSMNKSKGKIYEPDEVLITVIGAVQSHNLHVQNIKIGIGGFFNGLNVGINGIKWALDTTYLLYSSISWELGKKYTLFKFNRDHAAFLIGENRSTVFHTEFDVGLTLIEKWGEILIELSTKIEIRYFGFLSYDKRTVVVIDKLKEHGVEVIKSDNGYLTRFSQYAMDCMSKYSETNSYVIFTNFDEKYRSNSIGDAQ